MNLISQGKNNNHTGCSARRHFIIVFALAILTMLLSIGLIGTKTSPVSVNAASVKLTKTKATIWVGDTLKLKLINNKGNIKWNSSKKTVASVSSKGIVKAKKSGKTIITAKVKTKQYSCTVIVRKTTISKNNISLKVGESKTLYLKYPKTKVSWTSSNSSIAYADGSKVYGKSAGNAIITAKCNGKSYSCKVVILPSETEQLKEDGTYTSKDKVALYIHTYHKLPSNFITKTEAQKYGWTGGTALLNRLNKCIGGDRYYNYEQSLPAKENRIYYECDINTLGAASRGTERLVYSNDGLIYYTPDHYNTFILLYES